MKLKDLAEKTFTKIAQGDSEFDLTGAAGLDIAEKGEISFLANPKYTTQVKNSNASAIFIKEGEQIKRNDIAILHAKDPYLAYTRALRLFHPESKHFANINTSVSLHETAIVAKSVSIDAFVSIGANCEIQNGVKIFPNVTIYDNAKIGENSVIHSGVSIRENTEIGANCIVHNNCVIGSDGFGYAKDEENHWVKIPQTGRVVIEDDVEIGAGTCIDCASVGETRIKRGAKLDNLVQIGHSCTIDEDALVCAQTGLAGTSHIGKRVILAGQVGIAGHLKVGDDAVITAKSATSHDVENGKIISGIPAFDNRDWLRSTAAFRRLGEFAKIIRNLEKRILKIENKSDSE